MQTEIMFLNMKFFFAGYNKDYIKIEKKTKFTSDVIIIRFFT